MRLIGSSSGRVYPFLVSPPSHSFYSIGRECVSLCGARWTRDINIYMYNLAVQVIYYSYETFPPPFSPSPVSIPHTTWRSTINLT